jgi:molybdenum cofactor cytidylyltransferase
MNLAQALRLCGAVKVFTKPPRLAFVGAGGKTTLMFNLARKLLGEYPAVWITTTTHLGTDQADLADYHLRIDTHPGLASSPAQGVVLFTGEELEAGRLGSLGEAGLDTLIRRADASGIPLLIEADGSRHLSLKAPAPHEPAIPSFVNTVAVTAGLSGLGKPLGMESVHRPGRFAELAGLSQGETITGDALCRVLIHPLGGLKNIPPKARRVLLLNQADTPELRLKGVEIARQCLGLYETVVVSGLDSSLTPAFEYERTPLPQKEGLAHFSLSPNPLIFSVYEPHAIILLAAGASRRFGSPKQLVEWHGQPLVRHMALLALKTRVEPVRVVIGAVAEQSQAALQGLPVDVVFNPDWQTGQASSLRCGLNGLPAEIGGVVFMLVDQPRLPASLLVELLDLHAESLRPLTAPRFGDQRLNPVLFDRVTFPRLMRLQGDMGGRALFTEYPDEQIAWLSWDQPDLLRDFDTPEELEELR